MKRLRRRLYLLPRCWLQSPSFSPPGPSSSSSNALPSSSLLDGCSSSGEELGLGETSAASRRPEKRVQAAAASSLGCSGEAGSRVPTVSTPYLPYPDFFPLFLIRKRWDTAGYVYPGVSARVPVSPRTRTAIRQFLPYPCFVARKRI